MTYAKIVAGNVMQKGDQNASRQGADWAEYSRRFDVVS
jgi:hypothetical protein